MNTSLLKIRVVSFGYGLLSLFLTAILGVLVSPQFNSLVKDNFSESIIGVVVVLFVGEVTKHLRNLSVVKKLGAKEDKDFFLI